jgi:NH3-dependent NAD+ synthetase
MKQPNIQKQLATIQSTLEVMKNEQEHVHTTLLEIAERLENETQRVRKLENWRWAVAGGLVVVGSGVGLLFVKMLILKGGLG